MKRQTTQRKAILESLLQATGPLTPQEVLEQAKKTQPSLGLATVYRTLKLLEQEGEVTIVHIPGESARFEVTYDDHHHYFCCKACETVYNLDVNCPVDSLTGETLPGGFAVTNHALTFYGLCPTCQN